MRLPQTQNDLLWNKYVLKMYLLVSSLGLIYAIMSASEKKNCKLKKKQGFWKLITTLDQCARSSTPLSVVRTARHYHGTSSNLPATKRKQLKSSFFCLPTMLHWTCQCKQNVKFTKSRGIIWHIKLLTLWTVKVDSVKNTLERSQWFFVAFQGSFWGISSGNIHQNL